MICNMICKCGNNKWKKFEMSNLSRERYPSADIVACKECGIIYITTGSILIPLSNIMELIKKQIGAEKQQQYRDIKQRDKTKR